MGSLEWPEIWRRLHRVRIPLLILVFALLMLCITGKNDSESSSISQTQNDAKPVAPTHAGRVSIITAFIREQLEANDGRMAVAALLPALNGLPEYRVDQQRSKRNAHNYLMRLYGDTFSFEEGEGGSFISLRKNASDAAVRRHVLL